MATWHPFLTTPTTQAPRSRLIFWFTLSLTFTTLYAFVVLEQAFDGEYVAQDDTRQHVFWMYRLLDPDLFPNDLIADYFQSVAPWGFTSLYRGFAVLGINPLLVSKLLPVALSLITAIYGFWICLELLPIPLAGFIASVLIDHLLWVYDDVASATPRAFVLPLFLAFLYHLMRRSWLPYLATIALQGLFYPQYVFVLGGIMLLQPWRWQQGRLKLSKEKQDYWFCFAGLGVAMLVLTIYALAITKVGAAITLAEAKQLPDFYAGGRIGFFEKNPWKFWFTASLSGVFADFKAQFLSVGIVLPLLLSLPNRFPLVRQITVNIRVLIQVTCVALFLFLAAHALLFKLYLPSRYTVYSLRFVLVFATAITLTLLLDAGLRWLHRSPQPRLYHRSIVWGIAILLAAAILLYPYYTKRGLAVANYVEGEVPKLYEFFAQQPNDSLIASLVTEADNLPIFSQRSVLVSRETAIPFHVNYANQFRQRAIDLIRAHYSLDANELIQFIRTYGIDFWLLDQDSFQRKFLRRSWIKQYPVAMTEALDHLKQGTPILKQLMTRCVVFQEEELTVLSTECIVRSIKD
ncbi:MAG: hypothetical protein HC769_01655 [Cyanobacteria bacterium CRU_2_1]|nr:hypothetical protein [Cyanobacteria bacterium CRU_2_1]